MTIRLMPEKAFQSAYDACMASAAEADETMGVAIGNTYRRAAAFIYMDAGLAGVTIETTLNDLQTKPEWCFEYTHATQETDHGTCMTCCKHPDHERG